MPRWALLKVAMGRPRDNRCRACRRPLPDERARDRLTAGTDVCQRCASVTLAVLYRSRAARAWLRAWRERLEALLELQ